MQISWKSQEVLHQSVSLCSTLFHSVSLCTTLYHTVPRCITLFYSVPLCIKQKCMAAPKMNSTGHKKSAKTNNKVLCLTRRRNRSNPYKHKQRGETSTFHININININIDQCCPGADPFSLPPLLCSRRALSLCLKVLIIVVVFLSTTGALVVITV